jgi:hypothetical protein
VQLLVPLLHHAALQHIDMQASHGSVTTASALLFSPIA